MVVSVSDVGSRRTFIFFYTLSDTHTHRQFGHLFYWLWLDSSRMQCSTWGKAKRLQIKSTASYSIGGRKDKYLGQTQSVSEQFASNRLCCNTTTNTHTHSVHTVQSVHTHTHTHNEHSSAIWAILAIPKSVKAVVGTARLRPLPFHCLIYLFQSLPLPVKLARVGIWAFKVSTKHKRMDWQIINLQRTVSMRAAHTTFLSFICPLRQLKGNKLNGVKYLPDWMSSALRQRTE